MDSSGNGLVGVLQKNAGKLAFAVSTILAIQAVKYLMDAMTVTVETSADVRGRRYDVPNLETIEEIQKYIEELPWESAEDDGDGVDYDLCLQDLISDLSDMSDDEQWKALVRSLREEE